MAPKIRALLAEGIWVIAVRYVASNQAYQGAKIDDPQERKKFYDWVYDLEFVHNEIPYMNALFWLDVPFDLGLENVDTRASQKGDSEGKDGHEQQLYFARKVARNYGELQARSPIWTKVVCSTIGGGAMLPKEEIADEIFSRLQEKFQVAS